jgi:nicotinate-nucleotide adenylyltransferase
MRVGLFGGSFDPPHHGHVALARLAMDRLRLDRILIAPVGTQPLKRDSPSSGFEDRVAMTRLAFDGEPGMEVSLADAPRADGRPNYTVDTVVALQRECKPGDRIFCLMGADSFLTIGKWYRGVELLLSCDFIVGARPGFDLGRLAAALPASISLASEEDGPSGCLTLGLRGADGESSRLYVLPDLAEDISATEIRAALGTVADTEKNSRNVLAPAVAKYIQTHGLYLNLKV